MTGRPPLLVVALFLLAGALLASDAGAEPPVVVPPGEDVSAAIAAAGPGSVVELAPGRHLPFEVRLPVTVRAQRGAVVAGGETGVLVRGVDGVVLDGIAVEGAALHGIEVVDASATITGCHVSRLGSVYAQGIEVRNTTGRPRTRVERCRVEGGQEGIISHSSRLEIRDNVVTGTTMRGIGVSEMSEGLVEGNVVHDVVGLAYLCGDMSNCEIRDNTARGVAATERAVRSTSGHAVVVHYHSTARVRGTSAAALAGEPLVVMIGSTTVDRFPLSIWPPGWTGAAALVPVSVASVAGLGAVAMGAGAVLRRRPLRRRLALSADARRLVVIGVVGGFAVQAFHMVEHVVQVWQTYVAEAEVRSGLVGRSVDTEWVHFAFNASVLAFLVLVWRSTRPFGLLGGGATAWLLAAVVVQGYHLAEHTAKVLQHEALGVRVAPGIIGDDLGLVWFHFGINLAVFAGTAVAVGAVVVALRRRPGAVRSRLVADGSRLSLAHQP